MTKRQLTKIVSLWQQRLGLERWTIDTKLSPDPMDAYAEVVPSTQYESATLTFAPGWQALAPPALTKVVVHELLHLLLRDVDAAVEAARSQLHPQASDQVEKRYEHEIEGFIDRLASRIVEVS